MDTFTGHLEKMEATLADPVAYHLLLDNLRIPLNPLLGREVRLTATGRVQCTSCGRRIRKTYHGGHCYPCTITLACCDMCILKPELCHYHKGTCREPAWGERNCMSRHYVYLANASGIKVGITKAANIPTRWLDQGALQAIPILRVATRLQSGMFEVLFRNHVADKTNWRKMLQGDAVELDMAGQRDQLLDICRSRIDALIGELGEDQVEVLRDESAVAINYPVKAYPAKITSLDFTKQPDIGGRLLGIKGQYLMLSSGVLNIRKFTGYEISFAVA